MNEDWLMGFIEGEGCFCFKIYKYKQTKNGVDYNQNQVTPIFSIGQKEKHILKKIRLFLLGRGIKTNLYKGTGDVYRLQVSGLKNVIELCSYIETLKFHTVLKKRSFLLWRECINKVVNKEHLTDEGWNEIKKLGERINHPPYTP